MPRVHMLEKSICAALFLSSLTACGGGKPAAPQNAATAEPARPPLKPFKKLPMLVSVEPNYTMATTISIATLPPEIDNAPVEFPDGITLSDNSMGSVGKLRSFDLYLHTGTEKSADACMAAACVAIRRAVHTKFCDKVSVSFHTKANEDGYRTIIWKNPDAAVPGKERPYREYVFEK